MDNKDIEKRVLMYEDNDGEEPNGAPILRISFSCPTCKKNYLAMYIDRCPKCQQLLKW